MKFKDVELLPGVIIDVEDPKMLGRIKCVIPGIFDTATMDKEGIPWIYPLTMTGNQGFSKMQEGSKVWVFVQENNYREFWYIPMFEVTADTKGIISEYEEPEVVISRSAGANTVGLYYTDQQGIVSKLGDNSIINQKADGEIMIKSSEAYVTLKENNVYLGEENPSEPGVLGEQLYKVLDQLAKDFDNLANLAVPPYTSCLKPGFMQAASNIRSGIANIKCEHTFVS